MWWWNRIGSWGWQLIPFPWRMVTFWSSETWTSSTGWSIKLLRVKRLNCSQNLTASLVQSPFWIHLLNPHDLSFIETDGLGMARYGQIWEDVQDIYPQPSLVIEEFARTTTTRSNQGASPWNLPSSRTLAADGDFGGGNHQDLGIQDVKASQIGMQ